MKKLFVLFALVTASFANAEVNQNSSWEEIKNAGLIPGFSSIFFRNIAITVDALCVDGDSIRPLNPVREVCVAYKNVNPNHDPVCVKTEKVYLSTPRTYTETFCAEYRREHCVRTVSRTAVHPTTYNVTVYAQSGRPTDDLVAVFEKTFEMPACTK